MLWVSFFKFTLELHCRCLSVPFLTFHRRASHEKDDPKAGSKGSPEVDRDAQSRTLRTCQSFRRWQACKIHWATWCDLEVLKSDVFLGVRKQQHPLCFSRVSLISKKVFWGYSPNMFLSNAFVALSCYECLFATSSQVFLWSKLQYTSGVSLLVSSNADPEVNCREKPSMFLPPVSTHWTEFNFVRLMQTKPGWWFHVFVLSTPTWERFPIWLILF